MWSACSRHCCRLKKQRRPTNAWETAMKDRAEPRRSTTRGRPEPPGHHPSPASDPSLPSGSARPADRLAWFLILILIPILGALLAYAPALRDGFVDWDDENNFTGNPGYQGLSWAHLRWAW